MFPYFIRKLQTSTGNGCLPAMSGGRDLNHGSRRVSGRNSRVHPKQWCDPLPNRLRSADPRHYSCCRPDRTRELCSGTLSDASTENRCASDLLGPSLSWRHRVNSIVEQSPLGTSRMGDLPPPNTKRWVVRRKAAVVAAVRSGRITMEEALRRYQLSEEEFLSWQRALEAHGLAGLRATRVQRYREPRSPRGPSPSYS